MNEINQENYNEKLINPSTNLSLDNQSIKPTPFGNNSSLSNEILYFSINQDSE
jgi:hypothetical protein